MNLSHFLIMEYFHSTSCIMIGYTHVYVHVHVRMLLMLVIALAVKTEVLTSGLRLHRLSRYSTTGRHTWWEIKFGSLVIYLHSCHNKIH
jgi:hypothetical protein